MESLRGQTVFLTGASSGIGEALAREYARRGANLVLLARRGDLLERLAREISTPEARAIAVSCDVARDGELESATGIARREFSKIDVVIANAGFGVNGFIEDLSLEDYRRQFETNVYGVLRTFKATFEDLKKTKGRFAVVGSVNGHIATPTTSAYAMSKFAVRAFADSLRAEVKRYGISVTLISPGFIQSEIRKVDNQGRVHGDARDPVPSWVQMPAPKAARKIVRAVACRRRERILTFHGWMGVWLQNHAPWLMAWLFSKARLKTRAERLNAGVGKIL